MKTAISKKSKGVSVVQINTMTGRSGNVSKTRLKLEEVLEKASVPRSRVELANLVGAHESTIGHILNDMVMRGIVWNTRKARNEKSFYILSSKRDRIAQKSTERHIPTEPLQYQGPKCTRPEGEAHELVPSRRAHGYEAHRPMILMASKVRGGESAR